MIKTFKIYRKEKKISSIEKTIKELKELYFIRMGHNTHDRFFKHRLVIHYKEIEILKDEISELTGGKK